MIHPTQYNSQLLELTHFVSGSQSNGPYVHSGVERNKAYIPKTSGIHPYMRR